MAVEPLLSLRRFRDTSPIVHTIVMVPGIRIKVARTSVGGSYNVDSIVFSEGPLRKVTSEPIYTFSKTQVLRL